MKIKFPKKITIGETEYLVETDPKTNTGEFYDYEISDDKKIKRGKIIIGTKLLEINPTSVLNIIIHELKEVIQCSQSTRYIRSDTRDVYEFHYTHQEHTDLCMRLAGLLKEFIK